MTGKKAWALRICSLPHDKSNDPAVIIAAPLIFSDVTIPIANVMIIEDSETWKMTSVAASSGAFPTVIAESATQTYNFVRNVIKQNKEAEE